MRPRRIRTAAEAAKSLPGGYPAAVSKSSAEESQGGGFRGFPDEAFVFYEGLEADNSKTYWTAHKAAYEEHVRAPMLALLGELSSDFGAASMFRPYRDVRFPGQVAVQDPPGRFVDAVLESVTTSGSPRTGCRGGRLPQPWHDQIERFHNAVTTTRQAAPKASWRRSGRAVSILTATR
jgi:hypothetical protein